MAARDFPGLWYSMAVVPCSRFAPDDVWHPRVPAADCGLRQASGAEVGFVTTKSDPCRSPLPSCAAAESDVQPLPQGIKYNADTAVAH